MKRFFALLAIVLCSAGLLAALAGQAPDARAAVQPQPVTDAALSLPIVMYHHLSESPSQWSTYVLPVAQFERDLQYLRDQGYHTITTAQLINWCRGVGALPDKPVMITFDDGYESTFVYALPLLEQYGMTGVVSVIGAVTQQYTDLPDHNLRYSHMDWDAVKTADASGVLEVQCHTNDMHKLKPRRGCGQMPGESDEAYRQALFLDFVRFQAAFRLHTEHKAAALALPYGFYSAATIDGAKALNFQVIFTCTERINQLSGDPEELLELGRYNRPTGPDSTAFFAKWQ